ncbi:hypothetical protein E6W39_17565 [Kitasatospora acidiphila]|uniref:Excreted virulence factor EspC, type VII ESX diderm n=1 Tax=Kitasatospora acidiphila TaxID=2567942 RepID=A0A540W3V2_9ACTN|nr:hypothetical protein [Kitasatospora acidiphila]TQF03708.1 hypothetical protein E6W39_17565 [Kitasatospora acidiphila]
MSDPLDFERRMNPWLFDSSGNLTDQAKKQFPDLAAAATQTAAPSWAPTTGGTSVSVTPAALQQAGQNAAALATSVGTECTKPGQHVPTAVSALNGWSSSGAINTAWNTWDQQTQALCDLIDQLTTNLQTNGTNYTNDEDHTRRRFGAY